VAPPVAPAQVESNASPDDASIKADIALISNTATVNKIFADNQVPCSQFPSDYGAVPLNWLNLGGWIAIQQPRGFGDKGGFTNIFTMYVLLATDRFEFSTDSQN
jgi:hypothetical protein